MKQNDKNNGSYANTSLMQMTEQDTAGNKSTQTIKYTENLVNSIWQSNVYLLVYTG